MSSRERHRHRHYLHLDYTHAHRGGTAYIRESSERRGKRRRKTSFVSHFRGRRARETGSSRPRAHSSAQIRIPACVYIYVCVRVWMQRITCNYGPCHPPCLVPLCARVSRYLSRGTPAACVAKTTRAHAEYADNEM